MANYSKVKNYESGYPTPGPQKPTIDHILNQNFFSSEEEWKKIREEREYDYVVIGSGFCGYAFINEILNKDGNAKILLLERGGFHLPEHFQNLPLPYQKFIGGVSETFPWTLSYNTFNKNTNNGDFIKTQHGILPFFGGRSTTWSAWCPVPNKQETMHWNETLIERLSGFKDLETYHKEVKVPSTPLAKALKLLNVIDADILANNEEKHLSYGNLQKEISAYFKYNKNFKNYNRAFAAPLAANGEREGEDFHKFSTPENLLKLKLQYNDRLDIVSNVIVEEIVNEKIDDKLLAYALKTSRGIINLKDAKLIVATGTLPATTLIQNSFPSLSKVGERFSAHFITSIVARIRKDIFKPTSNITKKQESKSNPNRLSFGAMYVGGIEDSQRCKGDGEFHIQMTFIEQHKTNNCNMSEVDNELLALKHMPDVVATASKEQLLGGEDYITIVCAILGEISVKNPVNKFVKNFEDKDLTTNSKLSVHASKDDLKTWEAMDLFACDILTDMANGEAANVEYWISDGFVSTGYYKSFDLKDKPSCIAQNLYPFKEECGMKEEELEYRRYLTGNYKRVVKIEQDNEIKFKDSEFNMVRVPALVHESSTMWIDKEEDKGVVNLNYQPIGTNNVYITGGSLWPTGGSWNPTLMMTAMAIDLANCLLENKGIEKGS